jgi:Type II restriction endonuclease, TdeIII
MAFTPEIRKKLAEVFARPVLSTLERRTVLEPWDEAEEVMSRPFHHALVPAAVWKGSKFERSFTTSLGSTWEAAAVVLGTGLRGWAERGYSYLGEIDTTQLHTIQKILNDLEARRRRPDWPSEMEEVLAAARGSTEPCSVTVDVAVGASRDNRKGHEYFEVKAPQPNSDQTKVSKEKMFKLTAMEQRECAFFALPFNPYGTRQQYKHTYPMRWFDMRRDSVVLIAEDFWDRVGGPGTWASMLEVAEEVGADLRKRIVDEYLLD